MGRTEAHEPAEALVLCQQTGVCAARTACNVCSPPFCACAACCPESTAGPLWVATVPAMHHAPAVMGIALVAMVEHCYGPGAY